VLTESVLGKKFVVQGGRPGLTRLQAQNDIVRVLNPEGASSVVLICEHASHHIPASFSDLGLETAHRLSHAVWDPGALAVAERLSRKLDAKLVASCISRLVYDCNRPPDAPGAMSEQSETVPVPGNQGLTEAQKAARVATYYEPFRAAVSDTLGSTQDPVLVTVHSFTPVYHGTPRAVEIGVLHDRDARLADALLAQDPGTFKVRRNAPYGPDDGVTHTLKEHALGQRYPNVMLEIRNDLIATQVQQEQMAEMVGNWLITAIKNVAREDRVG
jgi:predicted N-formylglutamate amidohydrolase